MHERLELAEKDIDYFLSVKSELRSALNALLKVSVCSFDFYMEQSCTLNCRGGHFDPFTYEPVYMVFVLSQMREFNNLAKSSTYKLLKANAYNITTSQIVLIQKRVFEARCELYVTCLVPY